MIEPTHSCVGNSANQDAPAGIVEEIKVCPRIRQPVEDEVSISRKQVS